MSKITCHRHVLQYNFPERNFHYFTIICSHMHLQLHQWNVVPLCRHGCLMSRRYASQSEIFGIFRFWSTPFSSSLAIMGFIQFSVTTSPWSLYSVLVLNKLLGTFFFCPFQSYVFNYRDQSSFLESYAFQVLLKLPCSQIAVRSNSFSSLGLSTVWFA